jgi:amino acid adenylation domain-containing protein
MMPAMQPVNLDKAMGMSLPTDRPASHSTTRRKGRLKLTSSPRPLGRIRGSGSEDAFEARAVMLAAFETLLYRWSGDEPAAIIVLTGPAEEPVPGLLGVSGLLARADLSDDPDFITAVERAAGAFRNELVDLAQVQQQVRLGAAQPGHHEWTGGLRAMLVYHHRQRPITAFALSGEGRDTEIPEELDADLTLIVEDSPDGMLVGLDHDCDKFPPGTAAALLESMETLIGSAEANPRQPVSRLDMVGPQQREQLLVTWNSTARPYPRAGDVLAPFTRQALTAPDSVALRDHSATLTYGELLVRSQLLARRLADLGIGPGRLAGICTDRTVDMVVAMLGILGSGAGYVPLDPLYPRERLAFMVSDSGMSALVTQSRWMGQFPAEGIPVICLDAAEAPCKAPAGLAAPHPPGPDDPAYVIYTSGSTGKPKGVAVRRCSLANFLHAMQRQLGFSPDDRLLAVTTISFDIAGLEVLLPLASGGRVILASREDASEAARLVRLIDAHQVNVMQATPATWRMLLDSPWVGRGDLRILCGGEAMTREFADHLLRKAAGVWNLYGPTETTIWSSLCRIETGKEAISIGRPIDNTTFYILDARGQPVPVGAIGELYIGGEGLARGYLGRPELTADRFIPNPFAASPGERMYRTGDLARYWPDGRVECIGRVDHQVKIRGFRIELPEIEARLAAHPQVKEAAVTARDDGQGDKQLVAYWSARSEANGTGPEQLRCFLAEGLPRHMVPTIFVRLPALPLTPNGKIDRRALPPPDRQARLARHDCPAPRTRMERQLVKIWEQLLGVRPVSIRDDFFALGGHSLAAARLVARIEATTGISIPVSILLSAPTVESLARVLSGEVRSKSGGVLVPFRETGTLPPLFVVAGVGGHVLIFREMAELLGDDQPVYGLQGIGLDGRERPLARMEDIAARYIREIQSVQPEGPYLVSGWSMGGVIAYEIGLQLLARGERLGGLIIIDAYAPWVIPLRERVRLHLASIRQRSWPSRLEYVGQRVRHQWEVISRRLGLHPPVDGVDGRTAELVRESGLAQFAALRAYRPRPFPGNLVLLRAEQTAEIRDPRACDPQLGWGTLVAGGIRTLPLTGSHTGIFVGDNVRTLARTLRLVLSRPDALSASAGTPTA